MRTKDNFSCNCSVNSTANGKCSCFIWIGILALIGLEQGIKLIIYFTCFNVFAPIIPPFLYFEPMFNRDYSWINSMLKISNSKLLHIIGVGIMIVLICAFFCFIVKRLGTNRLVNVMFSFLIAGAVCSFIDKVFWDGSLDYILLKGMFTFDLKDVYIDVFIGLVIIALITKNSIVQKLDEEDVWKRFVKFITRRE